MYKKYHSKIKYYCRTTSYKILAKLGGLALSNVSNTAVIVGNSSVT